MERQELINRTYQLLVAQGGPSAELAENGISCLYRGPDGRKCAAGHWIPDDKYTHHLEQRPANCDSVRDALPEALRDEDLLYTLRTMQSAHDAAAREVLSSKSPRPWPVALRAEFECRHLKIGDI